MAQLLAFLDVYWDESGIVYCSTRKQVNESGRVPACPGLDCIALSRRIFTGRTRQKSDGMGA